MIIDLILDRRDGDSYNPKLFYSRVMRYGDIGFGITRAMDGGTEKQVKNQLCKYIIENEYRESICDFVNSVPWLK